MEEIVQKKKTVIIYFFISRQEKQIANLLNFSIHSKDSPVTLPEVEPTFD